MRLIFSFFLSVFISFSSFAQSFSLSDLTKMSKMNVDNFDTFVTSKGYVFDGQINEKDNKGVRYAINLNYDKSEASKYVILYQKSVHSINSLRYVTPEKKEYINIKNQLKSLGFKLWENTVEKDSEGAEFNVFYYVKGNSTIEIYASYNTFDITYSIFKL